jgi:O-acetyl-ADP-ribose deacetylase (regulator of RNase III)
VIHAAVMGQDLQTSATLIDRATRNALQLAAARQLTSIGFPAFGTGVGGFPLAECARIMLDAIRAHANTPTSLRRVRLVLFGRPAYHTFAEVAGERLGPPLDGPPDCPVSG